MSKIEEVAKAILDIVPDDYGMTDSEAKEYAKAAIEAMRILTPEMAKAAYGQHVGAPVTGDRPITARPADMWWAMIDAALDKK